jgi:DNA primase
MPAAQLVTVGGRRLRITNLDKVLYPETGTTKGDVIRYYAERGRAATRRGGRGGRVDG